jgi:hypothetical protein
MFKHTKEIAMAFVKLGQGNEIFSEMSPNAQCLGNDTFIDAMLSPEADFTKAENGEEIVHSLRNLPW